MAHFMKSKRGRWILGAAAAAVVGAVAVYSYAGAAAESPSYTTATVALGRVSSTVAATGVIEPENLVNLTFKNAGRVSRVGVKPGQSVKAGDVLIEQDTADLQAQVDQAAANVKAAEARLATLVGGARAEEIAVAARSVDTARVNLDAAKLTLTNAESKAGQDRSSAADALKFTQNVSDEDRVQYTVDLSALTTAEAAYDQTQTVLGAAQKAYQDAKVTLLEAQQSLATTTQQYNADVSAYGSRAPRSVDSAKVVAALQGTVNQLSSAATDLQYKQDQANQANSLASQQVNYWLGKVSQSKAKVDQDAATLQRDATTAAAAPVLTQQAVDTARNQVKQAEAAVAAADANYAKVTAGAASPDVRAAEAQVEAAVAALSIARNNLDAARMKAPFDGIVANINVTAGQLVPGGAGSSGVLVMSPTLQVNAQVNEADIIKVQVGQAALITANPFPGKQFTGKVTQISPLATTVANVQVYTVLLSLDSPPPTMRAGLPVNLSVVVAEKNDVLLVPKAAVAYAQAVGVAQTPAAAAPVAGATPATPGSGTPGSGTPGSGTPGAKSGSGPGAGANRKLPAVILVMRDGKAVQVSVELGLSDTKNQEVVSGIQAGDVVVTGAVQKTVAKSASASSLLPSSSSGGGMGGK